MGATMEESVLCLCGSVIPNRIDLSDCSEQSDFLAPSSSARSHNQTCRRLVRSVSRMGPTGARRPRSPQEGVIVGSQALGAALAL